LLTLSSISGQEKYRLCSPDDTGFWMSAPD
jgi:hypothetical protein